MLKYELFHEAIGQKNSANLYDFLVSYRIPIFFNRPRL